MSCMLVSESLIQRIASYVVRNQDDLWPRELINPMREDCYDALCRELVKMNNDAYCARYPKVTPISEDELRVVQWKPLLPNSAVTAIQIYADTSVLIWNCTEGDVDERPLYKWLETVRDHAAEHLICKLPEWRPAIERSYAR